jgi:formylglycine-generating enzyme required for sulfatase activity
MGRWEEGSMKRGCVWRRLFPALVGAAFGLSAPASAVNIDWVYVGAPGNAADTASNCSSTGCGSVSSGYYISKYEVTNAQYAEFLNAKATSDPLGLYSPAMDSSFHGGIVRAGASGSYAYTAKAGYESKPVNFVSFYDSLRFTNWLHNGQGSAATETGAYTLLGATPTPSNGATVGRNPGAIVFLPTENEWYKAAYFDLTSATYFDHPAASDAPTHCSGPTSAANHANCSYSTVTAAGAYTGSASPVGTFDQGGNVREWNEEIVWAGHRGVRGGGWSYVSAYLSGSYYEAIFPGIEDDAIGFRVASIVPEPGTGLLLMLGLVGLGLRRRVGR